MKCYLARFIFRCGESEISFLHGVEASEASEAKAKIERYLESFADDPVREDGRWLYQGGEFAVWLSELIELPDDPHRRFEALWRELLPIR